MAGESLLVDRFQSLESVENSQAYATEFEYPDDEPASEPSAPNPLILFHWIRQGANAVARDIRCQAVFYVLSGGAITQERLAKELGVTKQAINQQANNFRDFIAEKLGSTSTIERVARAAGMRSEQARQTFAKVCKSYHQKRKASLTQAASPTKSTPNSAKQSDLRAKVLAMAGLQ